MMIKNDHKFYKRHLTCCFKSSRAICSFLTASCARRKAPSSSLCTAVSCLRRSAVCFSTSPATHMRVSLRTFSSCNTLQKSLPGRVLFCTKQKIPCQLKKLKQSLAVTSATPKICVKGQHQSQASEAVYKTKRNGFFINGDWPGSTTMLPSLANEVCTYINIL